MRDRRLCLASSPAARPIQAQQMSDRNAPVKPFDWRLPARWLWGNMWKSNETILYTTVTVRINT
jgi:hypothetical protein